MPYTPAREIAYLHELFSHPIPIVAACNRVQRQNERAMGNAWWKGVFWGLGSVGAVFAIVMAIG